MAETVTSPAHPDLLARWRELTRPANRPTTAQFGLPHLAWASALTWIVLYLADVRVLWDRPTHLLVAPVLVALSWPSFQGFSRQILKLGSVLLALWFCQGAVGEEFQWRSLLEVLLAIYFFSLTPFRTSWGRRWTAAGIGIFLIVSFSIFLASIFVGEIRDWRAALYLSSEKTLASLESASLTEEAMTVQQGGLSPYLHLFGYQIAGGVALLFSLATLQRGMRGWIWYPAVGLGVLTLFLAGQRSAFLALAIAAVGVIVIRRRFRTAAVLAVALGGLVLLVVQTNPDVSELRNYNVVERMQTSESDFGARLALQWWAINEVLYHPLGLAGAGIDYFEVAPDLVTTRIVAPHNGYVTRLLLYGWPVGILTLIMFRILYRMSRTTWKRHDESPEAAVELAALLALLGVMANALFHNASFTTFNADTLVMLFLYGACSIRCAEFGVEPAPADGSCRIEADTDDSTTRRGPVSRAGLFRERLESLRREGLKRIEPAAPPAIHGNPPGPGAGIR